MNNPGRPLSPHLTIYRWPITMVLSILHRMSGVALSISLIAFAAWLLAASGDAAQYSAYYELFASASGRFLLIAATAAFFLHFANGIRHLVWDAGRGFEPEIANRSGWFVVLWTVVATAAYWWLL